MSPTNTNTIQVWTHCCFPGVFCRCHLALWVPWCPTVEDKISVLLIFKKGEMKSPMNHNIFAPFLSVSSDESNFASSAFHLSLPPQMLIILHSLFYFCIYFFIQPITTGQLPLDLTLQSTDNHTWSAGKQRETESCYLETSLPVNTSTVVPLIV